MRKYVTDDVKKDKPISDSDAVFLASVDDKMAGGTGKLSSAEKFAVKQSNQWKSQGGKV